MKFSSKSRAACFYCISPDLLICIIFYAGQITCRCWCRQSADAQHAKSNSGASNLHRTGASNLTDNTMMAIALIRSICVKGIVSKEVMSAVEKKGKKVLEKK